MQFRRFLNIHHCACVLACLTINKILKFSWGEKPHASHWLCVKKENSQFPFIIGGVVETQKRQLRHENGSQDTNLAFRTLKISSSFSQPRIFQWIVLLSSLSMMITSKYFHAVLLINHDSILFYMHLHYCLCITFEWWMKRRLMTKR